MTAYIVWNAARTEGFVTTDKQLAYEARKGAESNCFYSDGTQSHLAQKFCELYSGHEDCSIKEVAMARYDAVFYDSELAQSITDAARSRIDAIMADDVMRLSALLEEVRVAKRLGDRDRALVAKRALNDLYDRPLDNG